MAMEEPPPLYFLEHIPKTGGSSMVDDISAHALSSCGNLHCVAPGAGGRLPTDFPHADRLLHNCSFIACEGTLHFNRDLAEKRMKAAAAKRGERSAIRPLPVLLLLRQPEAHLISMFAHCQQPGSAGRGRRHPYPRISIESWFKGWGATASGASTPATENMKRFCRYDPRDPQVRHLGTDLSAAPGLHGALQELEGAFWVGVTEQYTASLCLLVERVGRPLPAWCRCNSTNAGRSLHHVKHGTNTTALTNLSGLSRAAVASLTALDLVLYAEARGRLHRELNASEALRCWAGRTSA